MMDLKRITNDSIPAALESARRCRMLNDPLQAESICRDIQAVEPENQEALVLLILALADQFPVEKAAAFEAAKSLLAALTSPYQHAYYDGVIKERWAAAQLADHMPQEIAFDWLRQAMRSYEKAEQLAEPGCPDSILQWNTCVRVMMRAEARKRDGHARRDVVAEHSDNLPVR